MHKTLLTACLAIVATGCALEEFDDGGDGGVQEQDPGDPGVGEGISLPPPVDGEDPGTPAPRPDDPGCVGVNEVGSCRGTSVVWCENDVVRTIDCAAIGDECGWDGDDERYFCVSPGAGGTPPPPPDDPPPNDPPPDDPPAGDGPCEGLDFLGECRGTMARWCDGDEVKEVDCAWWGQNCGWVDNESGYYCGGNGERPGGNPPPNDPPPPDDPPPNDPPPNDPPPNDPPPPPADPPPDPPLNDACGTAEEKANVMLTNAARAMAGQPALACAEVNTVTARKHSEDMCNQGYFSHTGRDGSQPWDRLRREGGQFRTAGENIAQGYRDADAVHVGWMNSPGHRRNILSGNYRRIGVGLAPCNGRMYWTQVFSD